MTSHTKNMGYLFFAFMWISMMGLAFFSLPTPISYRYKSDYIENMNVQNIQETTAYEPTKFTRPRSAVKFSKSRLYVVFWNIGTCNTKYKNYPWYTTDLFEDWNVHADRIWSHRHTIVSTWRTMVTEMVPGDDENVQAFFSRIPISIESFYRRDITCNEEIFLGERRFRGEIVIRGVNLWDLMFQKDQRRYQMDYFIQIYEPDEHIVKDVSILKVLLNGPFAEIDAAAGYAGGSIVNLNTKIVPDDMSGTDEFRSIRPWMSVLLHEIIHCFDIGHSSAPTSIENIISIVEFSNLMGMFIDNFKSGRLSTHYLNGAMADFLGIADAVEIVKSPRADGIWQFAGTIPIMRWRGNENTDDEQESFWRNTRSIVVVVPTLIVVYPTLFIDATIFQIPGRGYATFGKSGRINSDIIYIRSHVLINGDSYLTSMMPVEASGSPTTIDLDIYKWPLWDGTYIRKPGGVTARMPAIRIRSVAADGYVTIHVCYKRYPTDECDETELFVQTLDMFQKDVLSGSIGHTSSISHI